MMLRTTELENMPGNLCTGNILDQKSSIFVEKVMWPGTCNKREISAVNAQ